MFSFFHLFSRLRLGGKSVIVGARSPLSFKTRFHSSSSIHKHIGQQMDIVEEHPQQQGGHLVEIRDFIENRSKDHHVEGKKAGQSERFCNPWPSFERRGLWDTLTTIPFMKMPLVPPAVDSPSQVPIDWERVQNPPKELQITWLGHACFLVQLDGLTLLLDPALSERCSPFQFMGPKRYTPSPVTPDQLPHLDGVLFSHCHYDHLDEPTVRALKSKVSTWFVPEGNGPWMHSEGVDGEIVELDWWQSGRFKQSGVEIVCTPSQHFANRGLTDRNATLWSGWAILGKSQRLWFGGDTGYRSVPQGYTKEMETQLPTCPIFKEIGERLGPFDLSLIPIGAYEPRFFMSPVHLNPFDAVCVHQDVASRLSVGCHWGTWTLTEESIDDPPKILEEAMREADLPSEQFITLPIGGSLSVSSLDGHSQCSVDKDTTSEFEVEGGE